jgi:16S rRNA (adenine(1408)-N(1))-methyltransferase
MECIRGKKTLFLDAPTLAGRLRGYEQILVDIGTGDGRFVQHIAATQTDYFALGVDACRENLRRASRKAPDNALYVIANALALPRELYGLATHISINFPWGSLLDGLLEDCPALMSGLAALARPGARIDVRLNSGALTEAGWSLEEGVVRTWRALINTGFCLEAPSAMNGDDLRRLPTTWARRLAFGRDPRAMSLSGIWMGEAGRLKVANLGTI